MPTIAIILLSTSTYYGSLLSHPHYFESTGSNSSEQRLSSWLFLSRATRILKFAPEFDWFFCAAAVVCVVERHVDARAVALRVRSSAPKAERRHHPSFRLSKVPPPSKAIDCVRGKHNNYNNTIFPQPETSKFLPHLPRTVLLAVASRVVQR